MSGYHKNRPLLSMTSCKPNNINNNISEIEYKYVLLLQSPIPTAKIKFKQRCSNWYPNDSNIA